MRVSCIAAALPFLALGCTRHARVPEHRPTDLVDRMVARYGQMRSYHDHGAAMEWSNREDGQEFSIATTEFETSFLRAPARLRFAFRSAAADEDTVLVMRDRDVRIYDHGYEVKSIESIDEAQMRLRSPSSGAAEIVPTLLRGENPWTCNGEKPARCEIMGNDSVGNIPCMKVLIHRPPCSDETVCIDAQLLLRKASDWWQASPERQRKSLQDFIEEHPDHREILAPRLAALNSPSTDENTLLFFPQVDIPIAESSFDQDVSAEKAPSGPQTSSLGR